MKIETSGKHHLLLLLLLPVAFVVNFYLYIASTSSELVHIFAINYV